MIKLERNKMTNAINKAKQMRPRVRMIAERTYSVSGSHGNAYTVRFAIAKDSKGHTLRLGECTCAAGREGRVCYHLVAAAAVNIGIQTMRKECAKPVTPAFVPKPARIERRVEFSHTGIRAVGTYVDGWLV